MFDVRTPSRHWTKKWNFQVKWSLYKTAEDYHVGHTTRQIIKDKKHTWISELKLTFVPLYSRLKLQLLHYIWPTFKIKRQSFRSVKVTESINFSENRNSATKTNWCFKKHMVWIMTKHFYSSWHCSCNDLHMIHKSMHAMHKLYLAHGFWKIPVPSVEINIHFLGSGDQHSFSWNHKPMSAAHYKTIP